jgi:hypothetical protein
LNLEFMDIAYRDKESCQLSLYVFNTPLKQLMIMKRYWEAHYSK